ncbi:NOP protein chaperone 1 [Scyliorhinus torazame]
MWGPSPSCAVLPTMAAGSGTAMNGIRESARSAELLKAGEGPDINRKLLINKENKRSSVPPQILKLPRSSVMDKLQNFLPQLAKANEELRRQMETSEPGRFDIENIEDCRGRVIEMNVSLFELNGSDESGEEELTSEDESSQSESESFGEVTEANLKLRRSPRQTRSQIEVLSSDGTK